MIFLFQRLIFDKSFFMGDFLKDDNKAIGTSGRRLNKQTYSTILAALKNPSFLYDRIIYYIENSARTTIQKKVDIQISDECLQMCGSHIATNYPKFLGYQPGLMDEG